jgi:hypothetical protein
MQKFCGLAWVIGLSLSLAFPIRADEASAAVAVLDQAIKAHGGPENLAKTQLMIREAKGVMNFFGQQLPFNDELIVQLPERWRWVLNGGSAGQKVQILLVINGQKGWQSVNGQVVEVPKDRLADLREEGYVLWLTTLISLKRETGFDLTVLPDARVNDRPAAGIKVARRGHVDVKLYFDKDSGLLVKIERRAREAGLEIDKEYLYSEHKMFEGVSLPTKYLELTGGKKFVEVSEISYKFPPAIDESKFDKP